MSSKVISPVQSNPFDFDDDDGEGWQEMPVVREDEFTSGFDEEDRKKYHYVPSAKHTDVSGSGIGANATGNLIDVDDRGNEWRSKVDVEEGEYTRLRINEEDDADEVHLRTRYLFDEDKAMTPLSQMQATKNLLTEAQRIAYVGLCALTSREMAQSLKMVKRKELKAAVQSMELWAMKVMGRLYYHMELETQEQKMIESLATHGVQAMDLVPSLMTTHTVANPEYDPAEARRQAEERVPDHPDDVDSNSNVEPFPSRPPPSFTSADASLVPEPGTQNTGFQTTAKVLGETVMPTQALPGVTTELSSADKDVTLDIRWTVLCDLFLILIADSVYDARSRVLLENVALKLGLGWLDIVKFESRVTEALEIQEGIERMDNQEVIDGRQKAARKRRYVIMGLATLGGGLVIGLSAGLLAPVIGAGLGAAFTTIGIGGTTGFLAGAGGAAVITTGGVLTGSSIAVSGMARRTQQVRTFDVLPLHNNKRVSCILTVPGFMNGLQDDVRLPFSVLDPIVGDVFSVLWEPEMIRETGSALKILTTEVLTQLSQTVLQATVMTALMSALQWPIILTKLGYLIDNPWNNALDRARAAGRILADVLMQRHLGVRPITLIGFSLGARVIFYALLEMAKHKAYGIVQDVILLGATLTASTRSWCEARSIISGRFLNGFAKNDWVLNYLFRATSGGLSTVAGLRPIQNVPGLENVDVTDKIAGHMSYRTFMPLILDQLGFPVSADYFNEPEEPDFTEDRIVVREGEEKQKKGWFSRRKSSAASTPSKISGPPSAASFGLSSKAPVSNPNTPDDDLPPRVEKDDPPAYTDGQPPPNAINPNGEAALSDAELPKHAGFDLSAMKRIIENAELNPAELQVQAPGQYPVPPIPPPTSRSESAPPSIPESPSTTPVMRPSLQLPPEPEFEAGPSSYSNLTAAFQRSMSVGNLHEQRETVIPSTYSQPSQAMPQEGFGSTSSSTPRALPSALPSAGGFNSTWATDLDRITKPDSQVVGSRSFGPSTDASPFANHNGSISPHGSSYALPHNPFTSFSSPSPGLSFGGADGSITPNTEMERDPWDAKPLQRKMSGYSSNPWQS